MFKQVAFPFSTQTPIHPSSSSLRVEARQESSAWISVLLILLALLLGG